MNIIDNIIAADIYKNRDEWTLTHVTKPNPSCLTTRGNHLRLSRLLIGDIEIIAGYVVRRVGTDRPRAKGYRIGELKMTFAEVLDVLEGRVKLPAPVQLALPLQMEEAA